MKRLVLVVCTMLLTLACQDRQPSWLPTTPTAPPTAPSPAPAPNQGPSPITGTAISIGQSVNGRVEGDAPHCFQNWDSSALCRQFDLVTPSSGSLRVELTWAHVNGAWDPDLFLVRPNGDSVWAGEAPTPRSATISVEAGLVYRIVILSYRPLDFTLSTELQ